MKIWWWIHQLCKWLTFKSKDRSPRVPHRGLELGGSIAEECIKILSLAFHKTLLFWPWRVFFREFFFTVHSEGNQITRKNVLLSGTCSEPSTRALAPGRCRVWTCSSRCPTSPAARARCGCSRRCTRRGWPTSAGSPSAAARCSSRNPDTQMFVGKGRATEFFSR